MTNPVDAQLAIMVEHLDDRYDLGARPGTVDAGRCSPLTNYKDCSGFCNLGQNAGRAVLGLDPWPCSEATTFSFEQYGRANGLLLPVETAIHTRGMWVGWNHSGHGHMATSLGDGRQIAARSHALDLGIWPIGGGWEWGMKPIGFPDSAFGQPADPTVGGLAMQNAPVAHPTQQGYWCVNEKGEVFAYGAAKYYGGQGAYLKDGVPQNPSKPPPAGSIKVAMNGKCVGLAPTPTGKGYWLLTDVGSIYSFGDADYFGDPKP